MPISLSLREAIKKGRNRLGITQEALAAQVKCSRSLIANIERGTLPTREMLQKIAELFNEADRVALLETVEARQLLEIDNFNHVDSKNHDDEDMINRFIKIRRSSDVDISGVWNATWLTTTNLVENRNREVIDVKRRWNQTWQISNKSISEDNPEGGYLWVGKLELFDNRHLLGYYCACERNVLAKGTLCLELQPNGREIVGVWDGLNFDTMWATGLVALTRPSSGLDSGAVLDKFIRNRPKMPY